jgi:hypothetical protein
MARISDLLGAEVLKPDGTHRGRVRDVVLVQDGPLLGQVHHAFRLDAVVVGRAGLGTRLGYVHGEIERPTVLRWLLQRGRPADTISMRDLDWDLEARCLRLRR